MKLQSTRTPVQGPHPSTFLTGATAAAPTKTRRGKLINMRRTITTLAALVAAASLAACSTEDTAEESTAPADSPAAEETTDEDMETGTMDADDATATMDDAAATSGAAGAAMSDPVCADFFQGQGIPAAERADTTRDLLETGDPMDPVSFSELSLLQGRIDMLGQDASGDQSALLERINAPFTEVVDAVGAEDTSMEDEITIPEVDVTDSATAQDEFETACTG